MKKYENFCRALDNLKEGAQMPEPYSVVIRTGIVALFEICFEQSWKLMKEILEYHGRTERKTGSPREIIKIAYQCGIISDHDEWLSLLETRNILSHTYSDEDSLTAIKLIKDIYVSLFDDMKKTIDIDWLPEFFSETNT